MSLSVAGVLVSPLGEYLSLASEEADQGGQFCGWCAALLQRNAVQRVLSAAVLAPLVTIFLWLSPAFATSTVCSFVVSACSLEYACLSNRIRLRILTRLEALEGVLSDELGSRCGSNLQFPSSASLVSSETAEEDAEVGGTASYQSVYTVRARHSWSDLRSRQEEQEEEELARVNSDLRAQEALLQTHAVSELAARYFLGKDKLAAACVAVPICAVSSILFLVSVENVQKLQSTDFYASRWFYSITTSYAAAFCACMAPDCPYAVTVLVQYAVFTILAMYSTGCPLNDFSCGIGMDPEAAFLGGMVVLLVCRSTASRSGPEAFLTFMLDTLGLVYIAGTLSVLVAFVDDERRSLYRELLIALLYIVWASDTGAYVTGKALELVNYPYYNPLAAHLSKNKDYEGTLGAIVFGIGAMAVAAQVFNLPGSQKSKLVVTVIAVITGRFGDLFESLLKRAAGVKDSGKLIPGHGGMLDRIDALMFATLIFSRYYSLES